MTLLISSSLLHIVLLGLGHRHFKKIMYIPSPTAPISSIATLKIRSKMLSFWFALATRPPGFDPGNCASGSMPVVRSSVLDGEKGELVNSLGRVAKNNGVSEAKTMAALKNHREAERRRRDKINAHLATLRGLVPCNEKMDKAALLAEVINQVKQLKKTATQASEGLHLPMDTDEVNIEKIEGSDGSFLLRTSLCCEYRPDLLSDLRHAIKNLPVHLTKCEISTLGGRVKTVFLLDITKEVSANSAENQEVIITNSVRSTLSDILDKVSALAEYEHQLVFPQKRHRVSYLDSPYSSS